MKIKSGLKIRNIAGESVVMLRSNMADSTSRILSLNATSVYLWESLVNKEFTEEDVRSLLLDRYDVTEERAGEDASLWVAKLKEAGAFE